MKQWWQANASRAGYWAAKEQPIQVWRRSAHAASAVCLALPPIEMRLVLLFACIIGAQAQLWCPQDPDTFFNSKLNLSYPGLETVAAAWRGGDAAAACNLTRSYYINGNTSSWLRVATAPQPSSQRVGGSSDNMTFSDVFCFYSVCHHQPRDKSGELDWLWTDGDDEWKFALSRWPFAELGSAWATTGNSAYANYLRNSSLTWALSQPVPTSPSGVNETWRTIEAGIRMSGAVAKTLFSLLKAPEAPSHSAWLLEMASSAADHGRFLNSFYKQGNPNWQSMQLNGLGTAAITFPEMQNSNEWYENAASGCLADLRLGVYPDGVETEETSAYHRVATENFASFVNISRLGGRVAPAELQAGVQRMVSYLALSMDGAGSNPLNGDSDSQDEAEWLLPYADAFKNDTWRFMASYGQQGTAPVHMSQVWPWAGQVVLRAGDWFETRISDQSTGRGGAAGSAWSWVDIGPFGSSSHAHYDKLHLAIRAYGGELLVDSGRFAYDGPIATQFRETYARHTRGHNALMVSSGACTAPAGNDVIAVSGSATGVAAACDLQQQQTGPAVATAPLQEGRDFAVANPGAGQVGWAQGAIDFQGVNGTAVHARGVVMAPYVTSPSRTAPTSVGAAGPWMWVAVDVLHTSLPRAVRWHWHAHPNASAAIVQTKPPLSAVINHRCGASLSLSTASSSMDPAFSNISVVRGQLVPVPQGWYSPTYDVYGPSDAIQVDATVQAGTSVVAWVFVAQSSVWDVAKLPSAIITAVGDSSVTVEVKDPATGGTMSVIVPVQSAVHA